MSLSYVSFGNYAERSSKLLAISLKRNGESDLWRTIGLGQTEELLGSDDGAKDGNVHKQVLSLYILSPIFLIVLYKNYKKCSIYFLIIFTGCVPPCIFLLIIAYIGCYRTIVVVLLMLSVMFAGTNFLGFLCNHNDLAPNYAGILMGITNTPGTLPAFILPAIVGALTEDGVRDETF